MPVTLRYKDDGSGNATAAVYATVEEARAQGEHDALISGRVLDIIDGRHDYPHLLDKPKVLVDRKEFDSLNRRKAPQYESIDGKKWNGDDEVTA